METDVLRSHLEFLAQDFTNEIQREWAHRARAADPYDQGVHEGIARGEWLLVNVLEEIGSAVGARIEIPPHPLD